MRAVVSLAVVVLSAVAGCGQKLDHPGLAPACDPAVMDCRVTIPGSGSGSNGDGGASGDDSLATFKGQVLQFNDDYFDRGTVFSGNATVSATGQSGSRTSASYSGQGFELDSVLKTAVNWFLVEPQGTGVVATLGAIDTRTVNQDMLSLGLVPSDAIDQIFLNSGTDRSPERGQLVVHVVDSQLRSVPGIRGTLSTTPEITQYRMGSTWVLDDNGTNATDDSGMLFFGNVQTGSTLTRASVSLSGTSTSRIDVELKTGAVTVVNAIVAGK